MLLQSGTGAAKKGGGALKEFNFTQEESIFSRNVTD